MVAMILVIASVVIIAMLQGRTGDFSDYTQNQTGDSDCGLDRLRFERAISCSSSTDTDLNPGSANQIYLENNGRCAWATDKSTAYDTVC